MKNKIKPCERCIQKKVFPQYDIQQQNKQIVSPAYMTKKIKQLHTQNRKWMEKRKKLAEQRKKLFQQKQIQQCTFQPSINPNTSDFYIPKDPFIKRQRQWKSKIQKKKKIERQIKQKQQLRQLTFRPKISNPPNSVKDLGKQLTYSNRSKFNKTYQDIYQQKQQAKQNLIYRTKEPFQHRRVRSMATQYIQKNRNQNMKKSQIIQKSNPQDFMSLDSLLEKKLQEKKQLIQVIEQIKLDKQLQKKEQKET